MKTIIPTPAASLIITRQQKSGNQVLMGRRAYSCSFMPGMYVFPGGVVDQDDYEVAPASRLEQSYVRHMGVRHSATMAQTLAVTAVRETYEECGLMLAAAGNTGSTSTKWQHFNQHGQSAALHYLHYIGRAITPRSYKKRFNARFFVVDIDKLSGELKPSEEFEQLIWLPLEQNKQLSNEQLPMVDITLFILSHFSTLVRPSAEYRSFIFSHYNQRRMVRWFI